MAYSPEIDEYVTSALPDPKNPKAGGPNYVALEDCVVLTGWLGKSQLGNDYQRLYVSPSLDAFIDFLGDNLVHRVPGADTAVDPSTIWVKSSAVVFYTRIQSLNQQYVFLQGPIANNNAQQGGGPVIYPIPYPGQGGWGNAQGPIPSIVGLGCGTTSNQPPCKT